MTAPIASVDRPLALRLRPDLIVVAVPTSEATSWVVQDPATLEHFQFSDEEYALLDMLRRRVSLAEMEREFARRFPPQTITPPAIWSFVSRLHEAGLLVGDGPGQGQELSARRSRQLFRQWALSWTQLLAMRFRGVDPDRFLSAAARHTPWLWSRAMLVAVVFVVAYAAALVIGNFHEFWDRLPELSTLFDVRNWLWLALVIITVKMLHELGHAMACKHFGGEVHELGVILLAFMPSLYCDVSDAWRLKSKWQRISVSAAGMFVELVLASLATILWWHSQPGLINLLAMNVMVVCTVTTLMFNGNPLMRFDGYYILSDLADAPNLWQRSREVLRQYWVRWFVRQPPPDDPLTPARQRPWLATYGVASKIYISLVLVGIVWALVQLLYPLHLQSVAYAIGAMVLTTTMIPPVTGLVRWAKNPLSRRDTRQGRLAWAVAIALAATVGILAMPVTYYVHSPLVLLPEGASRVYATVGGTLTEAVPAGTRVEPDEQVAMLEDSEVQIELARLHGQYALQQTRLDHFQALRSYDPTAGDKIPTARAAMDDLAEQLADRRHDAQRLTLLAPSAGVVIPAPRAPATSPLEDRLPRWTGSLLDPQNRGALVEPGTLVCLVGDPERLSAVLLVDDTDIERLQPGQQVWLRFDQLPGDVHEGELVEVARRDALATSSASIEHGDLMPLFEGILPTGRQEPHYEASVQFEAPPHELAIGGRGQAKIAAGRVTLARWLWRYLAQTFRLPI